MDRRYVKDTLRQVRVELVDWALENPSRYLCNIPQTAHELGRSVQIISIRNDAGESIVLDWEVDNGGNLALRVPTSPDSRFAGNVTIQPVIIL